DNLQEKPINPNPSNRTMTDGTAEIKDVKMTAINKKLVKEFVEDILVNGKMEKLTDYFTGDSYIQHNPAIADGLSGLGKAIEAMAAQGIIMKYNKVHYVLGEGNFVLTVSEGSFADKHSSFYDLFRIENDKIAEHWDTIEPIPDKSAWKNSNGKF
ncbi:MAG TPA: nuclear transport factor 2 family protein, partial [Methanocella sp.]|nr:nuclear transport factor 2 family protein [Methanocella sp.]